MYSRKYALSAARRIRTCPPLLVVRDPAHSDAVARHRTICRHCSDDDLEGRIAADELAQKILSFSEDKMIETPSDESRITYNAGQIHYIASSLGCWRDDRYYNPPMVIVLDANSKIADDIRVVQVYDDTVLAGPGDLILDADMTGGGGKLFVECWNIYTLRAPWLDSRVGNVSQDVLNAIQAIENDPDFLPMWAALPMPMREDDPRIAFREMEVEVAYTFAARAAGELMETFEAADEPEAIHLDTLRDKLTKQIPGIWIQTGSASVADILATARLPEETLKLAAADTPERRLVANRVSLANGQVTGISAMEVVILGTHERDDGSIGFSGRIPTADQPTPAQVIFRFAESDDTVIEPENWDYDADSGIFTVTFMASSPDWKKLRLAVTHDES